jgi:hypothetical protein
MFMWNLEERLVAPMKDPPCADNLKLVVLLILRDHEHSIAGRRVLPGLEHEFPRHDANVAAGADEDRRAGSAARCGGDASVMAMRAGRAIRTLRG